MKSEGNRAQQQLAHIRIYIQTGRERIAGR